ncbi:MAG: hypothetical protein IJV97_04360 [Alphaproteobacteria bacterium]|nr:hypothetical protein [Alphaproteobacteria bacterium]
MVENIKLKANEEEFSDPKSIELVLDVEEDIKIPQDTVDNRIEFIDNATKAEVSEYGRPQLELTPEEIKEQSKLQTQKDLEEINESYQKGEIDKETKEFLENYFGNREELYDEFKNSLNTLFGCPPKSIKYINLLEGKVDEETPYFEEHVGPNTTMMYEYEIDAPWRLENNIPDNVQEKITVKVIIPKMKDVKRAIEKVKIGGKYDLERQKELAKLSSGKVADVSELDLPKLRTPIQKMKDILRCTVLTPRYDDLVALFDRSVESGNVTKSSRPSKYLDNDVKNAQAFFKNGKNYRDMKNYLHINLSNGERFFSEVQYKTEVQFFRADIKTHLEYEKARNYQQQFFEVKTEGEKLLYNSKIYSHLLNIQKLNSQAFEDYNLSVLQDARKMEDRLKRAGVRPEQDGSYSLCKKLLDANLLVRSSKALTDESFTKVPAWAKDIYNRYKKNVDKKYLVDIRTQKTKSGR